MNTQEIPAQRKPRRRRIAIAITAVVVASSLVAGVMYWRMHGDTVDTHGAFKGIGENVSVAGKKVPEDLKATKRANTSLPVTGVKSQGPVVDVQPGGKLEQPMQLRFRLSKPVAASEKVFVASRDRNTDPWQYQPATISRDGRYATITRTHLTDFWPFSFNAGEIFEKVKNEIKAAILSEAASEAERPTCKRESDARKEGYSITSSGGPALSWCFGIEKVREDNPAKSQTGRMLKITNRLRYPLVVRHRGLSVVNTEWQADIENLSRLGSGEDTNLPSFSTVVYGADVGEGRFGRLSTDYSGLAQHLHRLDVVLQFLVTIMAKFGGKALGGKVQDRWKLLDELLGYTDCANAVKQGDIGGILTTCAAPGKLKKIFDVRSILLLPFTTGGMLYNWLHGEFNMFFDMFGKRAKYGVTVHHRRLPTLADYAGKWAVHGVSAFVINKDGTGSMTWSYGPCLTSGESEEMCNGHVSLRFSISADGTLTGTYGTPRFETWEGGPPPAGFDPTDSDVRSGETFWVKRNDAHTLITGGQSPPGNPYLCDNFAYSHNDTTYQLCGA